MRIPWPVLVLTALTVTAVSVDRPVVAQDSDFHWSGRVARGKTIDIRGVHGSIRAFASGDDFVRVDARRRDPGSKIEVSGDDAGITVCVINAGVIATAAEDCRRGSFSRSDYRNDPGVDFVVRVPAGVRFTANNMTGDIVVESLRSEATVATISGNVNIQTQGFAAQATTVDGNVVLDLPRDARAEFRATTVSGTIDSDFPVVSMVPTPPPVPLLPNGRAVGPAVPSPPQIVRATIGGGGPAVRVTTVSGSVRLRRR